ncbi:MAG: hypothetical protein QM750_20035 [Rubrivivax sp.]
MTQESLQGMRAGTTLLLAIAAAAALVACGGGSSDGESSSLFDTFGPGNPSSCPRAQTDDIWFNRRLGCLAVGQRFVQGSAASGELADRAYIFGQEVLDGALANVIGANKKRYFKYTLCVRGAPANLSPSSLANDLGVAMGLNTLATGRTFYPSGVSGSTFAYGGLVAQNTLAITCSTSLHPVIVNYGTGRIEAVTPAALSAVEVIDA